MPNLVNVRSFIRICFKLVKTREPKVANFYKEVYARGHIINRSIEVVLCLYGKYEEL